MAGCFLGRTGKKLIDKDQSLWDLFKLGGVEQLQKYFKTVDRKRFGYQKRFVLKEMA
jgi:hypothetical protein